MNARVLCLTCLLPVLVPLTSATQTTFNPGRLTGRLRFVNASNDVATQCTADPAIAAPRSVILKSFPYGSQAAATDYALVNTLTGSDFVLGSYDISPSVPLSGALFQISTEDLRFQSGATYRFGSRYLNGVGAINCSSVFPTSINPNGTVCDQAECAVLVNVHFRLVSDPLDPPALGLLDSGATALPAACRVIASTAEMVGGPGFLDQQAASAFVPFPVSSLNGTAYQTIPLLVRGNTDLHIAAECAAPIAAGQTNGFVITPGTTNITPLSRETIQTFSCTLSGAPTAAASINIDIPVARTAGSIQGLLDLAGHVEENARVIVGGLNSQYVAAAQPGPTPNDPLTWQLTGVPSGITPVAAMTLTDQRDKFVIFPARDGLNGQVNIARGLTTDLASAFVAKPREVNGHLTLFDNGQADLSTLVTGAFSLGEAADAKTSSHVFAIGNPGIPQSGGASGITGESRGRLADQTPYNAATGIAAFNYNLLLPGIWVQTCSTVGGPACNVSWDFGGDYLMLQPRPDTSENLTVAPAMLLRVDTGSQQMPPPPVTAPDQVYCIGRADLTVNVDPALGGLFAPAATINSNTTIQPGSVPGTTPVSSVSGNVYQSTTVAQPSVSLPINLVAGIGYRLYSWVQFAPASGAAPTFATLPLVDVPATGVMPCGRHPICVTTSGTSGPSQALSVDILDATGAMNPSYCLPAGPVTLTAKVNSPTPASVLYIWDPPAGTTGCPAGSSSLCTGPSCGANPQFPVTSPALAAGSHSLRVCAADTLGCSVVQDFSFGVTTQNLALACPGPIVVTLSPGQTSVARSDPRLAALQATIVGNCGIPGTITDNAPSSFPLGTTTVTFTSPNIPACSTTVTVNPPRQFGVKAIRAGIPLLEIYLATSPQATLSQTISVEGAPFDYAFSPDGKRVAIVQNDGLTGVVDLTTSGPFFALRLADMTPSSIGRPLSIAWHAKLRVFAVLGKTTTVSGVKRTVAVFQAPPAGPPVRIQRRNIPMPANIDVSSLRFWIMSYSQNYKNPNRVIMAGSAALTGAPTMYEVIAVSANTDTIGRIQPGSLQTATTTPLPLRDDVNDISFNQAQPSIMTTIRLLTLTTAGTNPVQVLVLPNIDAALTAAPATWIAFTDPSPTGIRAGLVNIVNGSPSASQPYARGPNTAGDVAVTRDGLNVAVDSSQGIVVFDSAFNVISLLPDPTVTAIQFRP